MNNRRAVASQANTKSWFERRHARSSALVIAKHPALLIRTEVNVSTIAGCANQPRNELRAQSGFYALSSADLSASGSQRPYIKQGKE